MDNKKIGLFLQGLRKEREMTQLDMANKLHVTHQTVSKWEKGDSLPDVSMLQSLANFYQITLEEILQGERTTPVVIVDDDFENTRKWLIARLVSSVMVFISLFFYYLSATVNYGDIFNSMTGYNPFDSNNTIIKLNIKGFTLIFEAVELGFFTGGAWIIFLATLVLMTIFGLTVFSAFKKHQLYTFIKEDTYLLIKKIVEITLLAGYIMILLGAIFNSSVQVNIGYVMGLIFTIALFVVNFLEKKQII